MPPFSPRFRAAGLIPAVVAVLTAPTALAQGADVARMTCAAYLELPQGQRQQLTLWLHGYYAGAAQRTQIDPTAIERVAGTVQGACEKDGTLALIGPDSRAMFLGGPAPAPSVTPPQGDAPAQPSSRPQRPTPVR